MLMDWLKFRLRAWLGLSDLIDDLRALEGKVYLMKHDLSILNNLAYNLRERTRKPTYGATP